MSSVTPIYSGGPRSFTPAEVITGGQLVEARAAINGVGRVGVAAAGSTKVLGVALTDAMPPEAFSSEPVMMGGRPVLNAAPLPQVVAVAHGGCEVRITYSAQASFGDKLVATALGKVAPAGATPDARTIVGVCTEPLGVAAGATGLVRLD